MAAKKANTKSKKEVVEEVVEEELQETQEDALEEMDEDESSSGDLIDESNADKEDSLTDEEREKIFEAKLKKLLKDAKKKGTVQDDDIIDALKDTQSLLTPDYMAKALDAKVGIHSDDAIMMEHTPEMCTMFGLPPKEPQKYDFYVNENNNISFGNIKVDVIHTPGHTEGGVCYLISNHLFCGDTIFRNSYGRTDLLGGNFKDIQNSIKNIIFKLDDNIQIHTGHGESTTVEYEKRYNKIN